MKESGKRLIWMGSLLVIMFAVWTAMVQVVDVQRIGPMDTAVGFAALNGRFHELTGTNMMLYTITDWLGLIPIFICLMFGGMGLVQAIKQKSILKVDLDIIFLGFYYLLVISGYLIFEMIPVNYRPILIEGRLEASYPSSTMLLVLSVMPTIVFQADRRLHTIKQKKTIALLSILFSAFMLAGRLVSGVHWLTDIVGSVMLSTGLFCMYAGIVIFYSGEEK